MAASENGAGITASTLAPPPSWALLQRQLMALMEHAALYAAVRYNRPDGTPLNVQDADDAYEAHSYRGLFYALGGGEAMRAQAVDQWQAITRLYDEATGGSDHPKFKFELRDGYYTDDDWFHMGEGNQTCYSLGLATPGDPAYASRARRFADLYVDEQAGNYDPQHRIIRSPFHGSGGPRFHGELEFVKRALDPVYYPGGVARGHAQRANLHPLVVDLEDDWHADPQRRDEICRLFDAVVLCGDIPDNLACTGLVTNVYLHTGEEQYRQWVLDYSQSWLERIRDNDGIIPDNIGPGGKIGERRGGQWWGGWYGWNSRNSARNALLAATVAAECCLLLTGDFGYLELIRSQIEMLMDRATVREDGQLLVPTRMMPDGWTDFEPLHLQWLGRLYHASMHERDRALIERLKEGERESDWNAVESAADRSSGNLEARYNYYAGDNPDWPYARLAAEYRFASAMYEHMRLDRRDEAAIVAESRWPPNPVLVKGLVQVAMGAPPPVYNGGLLRATVRYFDADEKRPGLPADVAALVDEVAADRVGVELVNLSASQVRRVVVQAGAFGEHQFADVAYAEESREGLARHAGLWLREARPWEQKRVAVDARHFSVELPPATSIRLGCHLRRFAHAPSCALPWGG